MNKTLKILTTSIVLVGFLTLGTKVLAASDKVSELDVNDIIKLTTSNNSELNLFNKKIEVKKKWYIEALDEQPNESDYKKDMRLYVYPFSREHEIKELEWERDEKQNEVIIASTSAYYDILIQEQLIELQEKKIARLTKALDNKKQKINYGLETVVSLIDDETNLKDANTNLEKLKNDEKVLRMKLNMKTGNTVDKILNLKQVEIPYSTFEVKDLNDVVENMVTKYHTITSLIEKEEIDEKEKEIANRYTGFNTTEIENALNPNGDFKNREETLDDEITEIHYKMDDEKKNIESKVRIDYNNILKIKNNIEMKKLDYEKANILFETEKSKLQNGSSTEIQYNLAEENILSALCDYNKAKLDYYIAVENFKNYIKIAL